MRGELDAMNQERVEKYDMTAQRWREQPNIPACKYHEWHMECEAYSCQLWCNLHEAFVNPQGNTCEACRKGAPPGARRDSTTDQREAILRRMLEDAKAKH